MTRITSGIETVCFNAGDGIVIGERINPTGKKRLKEAYLSGDIAYVMREAVNQIAAGAKVLDINCGVPGIDEAAVLKRTVDAVESVVTCPLQIDTANGIALEGALRRVNGKALVNSVNGKRESMDTVFPIVRKYGGVIVGLCLDESGIPSTVEGRLAIARKILDEGAKYGFAADDFLFDALTLSVSSDPQAAVVTLETVRRLTEELKVNTVLGVSNVSFGLPNRPALNNAMYALAKRAGLSAAIANPSVIRDEIVDGAEDVLFARDVGCAKWIAANSDVAPISAAAISSLTLGRVIELGLKEDSSVLATQALATHSPMDIVNGEIVPALEKVGFGFESGKVYLPQLLMAAEAASAAFAVVRGAMHSEAGAKRKGPIVIATVKGDIHDIGKNIVRALLENYGFDVIDLGRDVEPQKIVKAALTNNCRLVGLSALMTTTVGAMEETIRLLKAADPTISTFVGGAVITEDFASSIGATYYTRDAMSSVRLATRFFAS